MQHFNQLSLIMRGSIDNSSAILETKHLTHKGLLLLLSIISFISCKNDHDINKKNAPKPGVVLSFDDAYVDEWLKAHNVLIPYGWKATFFVSGFDQLSDKEIYKLKKLQDKGHEIGGHSLNHFKAKEYVNVNGKKQYLQKEINPMLDLMEKHGFLAESFSYPHGSRDSTTDQILLEKFDIIRGTTFGQRKPASHRCFYSQDRLVYGLSIDEHMDYFEVSYLLKLMEYAKKNNKIVIFYGHKPVVTTEPPSKYETTYETLIEICRYANQNDMKFYTMSDLNNLES